jgi:hypothetical protein
MIRFHKSTIRARERVMQVGLSVCCVGPMCSERGAIRVNIPGLDEACVIIAREIHGFNG